MEININPESIKELISEFKDDISSAMLDEFENKFDAVFEDRFDDKIEDYLKYNYDVKSAVEDCISDIDLEDYIDLDEIDFENVAKKLLNQYDPDVTCSTGLHFTNAISIAIHHLLNYDSTLALAIKESIDKAMQMQVEAIKADAISNYRDQLEKYFNSVVINTNQTSNNPFETTNVFIQHL